MELTEKIDSLNKQLIDLFGIDTVTGKPIWRIVWSEEQFENRYGTYDDFSKNGNIFLRTVTEVRYVPKYRQWIKEKYVLERMVVIPDTNKEDLPDSKISYEPIWVFEDGKGNYLPPRLDAAKFIIDTIYASQYEGKHNLHKYADLENCQEAEIANRNKRIDGIQEELFGDQSSLQGTTVSGESIIVPQSYNKVN